VVADPDRTPPLSSIPEVRRDEGAGRRRGWIGEVKLVAVWVRNDHVPVAPLPFLHIHATPFQLRAQVLGLALAVELWTHAAAAGAVVPLAGTCRPRR